MKDAVCRKCGETNEKDRKPVVEVDERGSVYCNGCSETWSTIK